MIPILKVGRYKDASGRNYDITSQVLREIQESYTSKSAPLVKGHPTSEAPAMGWIDKLKVIGEELLASFSEVTKEFKKKVEQNSFRNVSASFFMPLSESNPQKGKYCLRHVGALGASRPAIPNLGTLQEALAFSEDEESISCYAEFSEQEESVGFFEKLIKGAIESSLKKQREEIMSEVKQIVGSINLNENQINQEAGIQLLPSMATLDSDILSSGGKDMSEKTVKADPNCACQHDSHRMSRELELEQENQKQKEEIDRLKSEQDKVERSKTIADEVAKVKEEKNLDEETVQKLTEKAEASSETDGKKAVANFSEFIEKRTVRTQHRFGNYGLETGTANFSEDHTPLEHTAEYADEIDKLTKEGVGRQEAHHQAMQKLSKK
ncbi:MAG: hypothetical protein ACRCWI_02205 [Brevinema sp.]